MSQATTNLK